MARAGELKAHGLVTAVRGDGAQVDGANPNPQRRYLPPAEVAAADAKRPPATPPRGRRGP